MISVALLWDVAMQPFPIKTIALKQCARCKTQWSTERITLEPHEQVNQVIVKIAYCPACAESFAAETDRATYNRTGKKLR